MKKSRRSFPVSTISLSAISVIFLLAFVTAGHAQRVTDVEALQAFSQEKQLEWQAARAEIEEYARANNIPIQQILLDGTTLEIQRLVNGIPIFYITHNANAAITTRTDELYPGGDAGLSLSGSGYDKLGIWDADQVRSTHDEMTGRVTYGDSETTLHYHATHCAGTLIASGSTASAKGMAYAADLTSYDWSSDISEMSSAAANDLELSNHSYGSSSGWVGSTAWYGDTGVDQDECYYFGFYNQDARDYDHIAYLAPYYLIVKSAGNDRNDDAPSEGTAHSHNGSGTYTDTHNDDGHDSGYDTMPFEAVAKNILTVGAVYDVANYTQASDVTMSSFSNWGPADDGRIKPDLVANGISVYSCLETANDAYGSLSGTSQASPNACGTLVLLQQHYQNTHSTNVMRSATLKALAIHTADEAGSNTGPDYAFGWGLLNAEAAADIISDDENYGSIAELNLSSGESYSRTVTATGSDPLRVTVVWTDPPGTPVSASLDPTTAMLVNDLDLRITKDASTYYPWKLDRSNPANAATNSAENDIDNVEQVYIASPSNASYTIVVDHDGSLTGDSQDFSIIVSGHSSSSSAPGCSDGLIGISDGATDVAVQTVLQWEEVESATSYDLYFGTDNPPTSVVNGSNQTTTSYSPSLALNTTYYIKILPKNTHGTASGCAVWSFSVGSKILEEDFDDFLVIGTDNNWTNGSGDDFDWSVNVGSTPSGSTGPSGDHSTGSDTYLFTESSDPNYPDKTAYLLSPSFDLSSSSNPTLEFWYHMYGSTMGELYVDVYANSSWNNAVWSLTGDQGNSWSVAVVDLSAYKAYSDQQLRFRAVTDGFRSDMAVDDVTVRSEAFYTFTGGSTSAHTFPNTGAILQFTSANSGDVNITAIKNNSDPGVNGSLPEGVVNSSSERYWDLILNSGSADGIYALTLDLDGMMGISDYSTLKLLKRANSSGAWAVAGTNAYAGSGTSVKWTGISSGFSQFGIGGASDNSLPVVLTSFAAEAVQGAIILSWVTGSEIENLGFILERREYPEGAWIEIAHYQDQPELRGQGSSTAGYAYSFRDAAIVPGKRYDYRLAAVDYQGSREYQGMIVTGVTLNAVLPTDYTLKQNYPNPFNPSTAITYDLPEDVRIRIQIFDMNGREIVLLVEGRQPAGSYDLLWNGQDHWGESVAPGVYFCHLQAGDFSQTIKMVVLK